MHFISCVLRFCKSICDYDGPEIFCPAYDATVLILRLTDRPNKATATGLQARLVSVIEEENVLGRKVSHSSSGIIKKNQAGISRNRVESECHPPYAGMYASKYFLLKRSVPLLIACAILCVCRAQTREIEWAI